MGIAPDIIVLRCDEPLEQSIFDKIAMFCNVKPDCVIENLTLPVLYEAPLMLEEHDFSLIVCRELGLWTRAPELSEWRAMVGRIKSLDRQVTIGLVPICPWRRPCATRAMPAVPRSTSAGSTARL